MSIQSARQRLTEINPESGYCLPLALDSTMRHASLPKEFYDYFYESYNDPGSSYNVAISYLLKEFFNTEPMPDTEYAPIAKFNVFGSSPQSYMPDITANTYNGRLLKMEMLGITEKQLRLQELLAAASTRGCNVLFSNPKAAGEHVSGLEVVDKGVGKYATSYLVRDWASIVSNRVYTGADLAGINQVFGDPADDLTPLPEVSRLYYPNNETSWELIILPPEPEQ